MGCSEIMTATANIRVFTQTAAVVAKGSPVLGLQLPVTPSHILYIGQFLIVDQGYYFINYLLFLQESKQCDVTSL